MPSNENSPIESETPSSPKLASARRHVRLTPEQQIQAAQMLLDLLERETKSLHASTDAQIAKKYAAYFKEEQDAEQYREEASRFGATASEREEAERLGEGDSDADSGEGDAWERTGALATPQVAGGTGGDEVEA
jgi:hypothetical protein